MYWGGHTGADSAHTQRQEKDLEEVDQKCYSRGCRFITVWNLNIVDRDYLKIIGPMHIPNWVTTFSTHYIKMWNVSSWLKAHPQHFISK